MSTVKAATLNGGARRRAEQTRYRDLVEDTIRGGFLVPPDWAGCGHEWICLDSGFAACKWCCVGHWCCRGQCPETVSHDHERVCTITGCVTLECELRPERNAGDRVGPSFATGKGGASSTRGAGSSSSSSNRRRAAAGGGGASGAAALPSFPKVSDLLRAGELQGDTLRDLVETTVREILLSDKTERCLQQERQRNEAKELAIFSRALREAAHDRLCLRPNVVLLVSQVAYHCRKNRQVLSLRACGGTMAERIITQCTDAIVGLLLMHGGPRVARQIQNGARYREFITSMLFLMRAGISFQGRQILPRMDILHQLLPLQVLLPQVFRIRAKSITEGENLVKLDMKRLPL